VCSRSLDEYWVLNLWLFFFSWYEVNHHDSIKLIRIFINELHKQCFNNFCCDKKKKGEITVIEVVMVIKINQRTSIRRKLREEMSHNHRQSLSDMAVTFNFGRDRLDC